MTDLIYDWKRFWCPREDIINLSDGGYLYDPDSYLGKFYNPVLVPFESISDILCLILLGEPRIGKTCTIRTELERIKPLIEKQGNKILFLDLRSYGSEDRLFRDLFESSTFISWKRV